MIACTNSFNNSQSNDASSNNAPRSNSLHTTFLGLVPRIENHARIYFAYIRCADGREDKVAETVALAWRWYVRLARRGKDVTQFTMAFIFLVARAVKSGRRLCGQERAKDVMNPFTQRRHGFAVESLPLSTRMPFERVYGGGNSQRKQNVIEERLHDNTVTPPPDQAAFRIDFPAWLESLTSRERRMIRAMMLNERTSDLAKKFEVSPARISQLRRQFHDDWHRFVGDCEEKMTA